MKIAVLHWATSGVGGISTTLDNYRSVAKDRGDTFHVFYCNNQRTKKAEIWTEPRLVRESHNALWMDGLAPHHVNNYKASVEMLKGYDVVMTSYLCPHPTKAYGLEPVFLPLLQEIKKTTPIIGYIHDAYWESYKEFGELTAPLCKRIVVCQKAYAEPILKLKSDIVVAYPPFYPVKTKLVPRDHRRVLWTPQWKNIKGIHKFLDAIPDLDALGMKVDLYNSGIEYYKRRLLPDWTTIIGEDVPMKIKNKGGAATFYGFRPLPDIFQAIEGAGFVCDFQGHSAKYEAYKNGSFNHTLSETLYYGAVPVVHQNILKSGIPRELVLPVEKIEDCVDNIVNFKSELFPRKRAKEYVLDNFSAERLYDKVFDGRKFDRSSKA